MWTARGNIRVVLSKDLSKISLGNPLEREILVPSTIESFCKRKTPQPLEKPGVSAFANVGYFPIKFLFVRIAKKS